MHSNISITGNPFTNNDLIDRLNDFSLDIFTGSSFSKGTTSDGLRLVSFQGSDYSDSSILAVQLGNSAEITFEDGTYVVAQSAHAETPVSIVRAGLDTYALTSDGTFDLLGSTPTILGSKADPRANSRLLMSGSTLMFSDLPGPNQPNESWFNTANNSYLWKMSIDWVSEKGRSQPQGGYITDFATAGLVALIGGALVGISLILFIIGQNPNYPPSRSQVRSTRTSARR